MTDTLGGARLGPPTAGQRNAVFGAIGVTIVLGWVGDALWASLVDRHPLALILLNAKPRYLVLTVNELDGWTYYLVGTFRLLFTKPLVWLVGAWYGNRAVRWAEGRSPRGGALLRWVERHFGRWGWAVIAVTSNNLVCLVAGATGFSLGWFMVLAIVGTVIRLWMFSVVGDVFSRQIDSIIGFVGDHRLPIVAASITIVVVGLWWQHRSGGSELDELADLEHSVEELDALEPTDGDLGR